MPELPPIRNSNGAIVLVVPTERTKTMKSYQPPSYDIPISQGCPKNQCALP